jgi:hypothetical protein
MSINPWYRGDTMPIWKISLIPDTGTFDISALGPSNFSLIIRNIDDIPQSDTVGTGIFSNVTAAVLSGATIISHASVQYLASSSDVATLGNFVLFVIVAFPGGSTETFSIGSWQVIAR